jgi:signal-transduction protein with cAMP-binding, CBS, and nucleotidyltransferase domain
MSAPRPPGTSPSQEEVIRRLLEVAGHPSIPADVRDAAVAGGRWVEAEDGFLGAEVTCHPVVVEDGVLLVIGRDGRPQDLLGPGRLAAPNPTQTLQPLVPSRLLVLPDDVTDALVWPGAPEPGPVSWARSLERVIDLPGIVVDAEVEAEEVARRLAAAGRSTAAVTGRDRPAAVEIATVRTAGRRRVGEVATTVPVVDAEAPLIEVLTALITAGTPLAALVSADVPVGALALHELPLPVGPGTRAACHRTGRSASVGMSELTGTVPIVALELLDAGAEASAVARALTAITVQVIQSVVEVVITELGEAPARFALLAFGSLARGEVLPDSDLDTGLAWDARAGADAEPQVARLAERTIEVLRDLGHRIDPNGVSADRATWRRDLAGWREAVDTWTDPTRRYELIGAGIALDARTVAGELPADERLREALRERLGQPAALTSLAADAVRRPAPRLLARRTGWRSEQLRRRFDLKRDLGAPIVDLARLHTLDHDGPAVSTLERLASAADRGSLDPRLAVALRDGFDLALRVRLARSVGRAPPVADAELGIALAPAIRALAGAQRQLRVRYGVSSR